MTPTNRPSWARWQKKRQPHGCDDEGGKTRLPQRLSGCIAMNHLGNYFHEQRKGQGLSLGQLAVLVGYRNVSKGANRIARFEREGIVTDDLLAALADALGIDLPNGRAPHRTGPPGPSSSMGSLGFSRLCRYSWSSGIWQPFMASVKKPGDITTHAQAEAFACEYARTHRLRVCLILSRRHSVWIDEEGKVYARTEATPDKPNMPWMQLRSDKRKFLFRSQPRPVSQRADSPA